MIHAGGNAFEVRNGSFSFKVKVDERTCSCRMWQLSGLPCVHGTAAILKINKLPEQYVPNWFRKELYYATYHNYLSPVGGIDFWPDQSQYSKVLPPIVKKMPGRPRKKRVRAKGEGGSSTRVSKVGVSMTCQNCFKVGHNKKGCKEPPGVKPVKQKRRCGRPSKEPSSENVDAQTDDVPPLAQLVVRKVVKLEVRLMILGVLAVQLVGLEVVVEVLGDLMSLVWKHHNSRVLLERLVVFNLQQEVHQGVQYRYSQQTGVLHIGLVREVVKLVASLVVRKVVKLVVRLVVKLVVWEV